MLKNKENTKSILICSCESIEHQLCLSKDTDDNVVYLTIHLKPSNLWGRIKNGLKYIFGHRSIYGDFDEFILKEEHGDELIEIGKFLKENGNE